MAKLVGVLREVSHEIQHAAHLSAVGPREQIRKNLKDLQDVDEVVELSRNAQQLVRDKKSVREEPLRHDKFKLDKPLDQEVDRLEPFRVKRNDFGTLVLLAGY